MKVLNIALLLLPLIVTLSLFSCGIESFEPQIILKPPLNLRAYYTNSPTPGLMIKFDALNDETYFSGFKIYMSRDYTSALAYTNGGLIPNPNGGTAPTLDNISSMTSEQEFQFLVTKDYSVNPSGDPFPNINFQYYFYVRSYSGQYNIVSLPSNITNATHPYP